MKEFLQNKAGLQLAQVVAVTMLLFIGCLSYEDQLLRLAQRISAGKAHVIVIVLALGGLASFAYSLLRVLDMRNEMVNRRKAFAEADRIATHDHLTKLPNRYAFDRLVLSHVFIANEVEEEDVSPTVTLFSIDLDGFKKVNDLLGHQGGDVLLKEVSQRICALAENGCIFRFGGDEFVAVASNMSAENEAIFAQLLIHAISRPVRIGNFPTEVGASVGYARLPDHGSTLEEVCHRSDIALYEAKSRGHNQYSLFHPQMQEKATERAKLEGELRRAIDAGTIEPFYQPLINLRSGDICGFEALARWQVEEGVFIPPQMFIAVAEETGMITPLFEQLLLKACRDAQLWPETLSLSFNISAIQMKDRLLVSRVLDILQQAGLPSYRLEVEITENALIDDPDLAVATIEKFHLAGIQVALDDFGTGYSSLSQLARFKFDKIKIDKSFVSDCTTNEKNAKIIDAMLGLSRSLHLKTTVEGIEDSTQLEYFQTNGCDIGQGYIFGKAVPQKDVIALVSRRMVSLSA